MKKDKKGRKKEIRNLTWLREKEKRSKGQVSNFTFLSDLNNCQERKRIMMKKTKKRE